MSMGSFFAAIAALALGGLAVSTVLRGARLRVELAFAALCCSVSIWLIGRAVDLAGGATQISTAGAILGLLTAPPLALFFSLLVADDGRWRARLLTIVGLATLALSAGYLIAPLAEALAFRVAGWIAMAALGLTILWRILRRGGDEVERLRSRALAIGTAAALVGGLLTALPVGGGVNALGEVLVTSYLFLLAQYLRTSRMSDIADSLAKAAALSVLAVALAVVYTVFFLWAGLLPGRWFFYALLASYVVLLLFDQLQAGLVGLRVFNRRVNRLRAVVDELRRGLGRVLSHDELVALVAAGLTGTGQASAVQLWLAGAGRSRFVALGAAPGQLAQIDATSHPALVGRVLVEQAPISALALARRAERLRVEGRGQAGELRRVEAALTELRGLPGDVLVPLLGDDRIAGLLLVAHPGRPGRSFSGDELALLAELGGACAAALEAIAAVERHGLRDRLDAVAAAARQLAPLVERASGAVSSDPIAAQAHLAALRRLLLAHTCEACEHPEALALGELLAQRRRLPLACEEHLAPDLPAVWADRALLTGLIDLLLHELPASLPGLVELRLAVHRAGARGSRPFFEAGGAPEGFDALAYLQTRRGLASRVALTVAYLGPVTLPADLPRLLPALASPDQVTARLAAAGRALIAAGGWLDIQPRPAEGALLTVHLPIAPAASPASDQGRAAPPDDGAPR